MINPLIIKVYQQVSQLLLQESQSSLKSKINYLGIQTDKSHPPNKQRIMFIFCQHIINLIDQFVNDGRQTQAKNICTIKDKIKGQRLKNQQGNGYFQLAALFFYYFCGTHNIYDAVRIMKQIEEYFRTSQDLPVIQAFKPNQHVKFLENQRHFTCPCDKKQNIDILICERCMQRYHPECQYQKLLCNKCFLTHCFFPLDNKFISIYGEKTRIKTYFHSSFRCKATYLVINFTIDDFKQLQSCSLPQIYIKIKNFSPQGLSLSSTQSNWLKIKQKAHQKQLVLNQNKLEIYWNFQSLKRKNLIFHQINSIIIKLENRLPNDGHNVLVIKCQPGFFQLDTYQIGIFRISKIKNHQLNQSQTNSLNQNSTNMTNLNRFRLSQSQHCYLKKYGQKMIHRIKIQSLRQVQKKSQQIKQLVRSYGCLHKQGFSLSCIKSCQKKLLKARSNLMHQSQTSKHRSQLQIILQKLVTQVYNKHIQQKKPLKQQNPLQITFKSIRKYCMQNDLMRMVKIPQHYQINLVNSVGKKVLGFFPRKKNISQIRKDSLIKQQKKHSKFVKCPICNRYLMVLYLMPYDKMEGDQIKIPKTNRLIRSNHRPKSLMQQNNNLQQPFKRIFQKQPVDFRIQNAFPFPLYKKQQQQQQQQSLQKQGQVFMYNLISSSAQNHPHPQPIIIQQQSSQNTPISYHYKSQQQNKQQSSNQDIMQEKIQKAQQFNNFSAQGHVKNSGNMEFKMTNQADDDQASSYDQIVF